MLQKVKLEPSRWEDRQLWKQGKVKRWDPFYHSRNTCLAALIKNSSNLPDQSLMTPCATCSSAHVLPAAAASALICVLCAWKWEEKIDPKSHTQMRAHTPTHTHWGVWVEGFGVQPALTSACFVLRPSHCHLRWHCARKGYLWEPPPSSQAQRANCRQREGAMGTPPSGEQWHYTTDVTAFFLCVC